MSEESKSKHAAAATPTGKRQLAGTASAPAGGAVVASGSTRTKSEKPGGGPLHYIPEVISEMRKVIWPTGKEMITYTLVVFAFLIVLSALVSGADFLAGLGVEKILAP